MNTYEYWIAEKDDSFIGLEGSINITIGEKYEVHKDSSEQIYIIDDSGKQSMIFLGHNGRFEMGGE